MSVIHISIVEIQKAIKGIVLMSETLERVGSMVMVLSLNLESISIPIVKTIKWLDKRLICPSRVLHKWISVPKVTWFMVFSLRSLLLQGRFKITQGGSTRLLRMWLRLRGHTPFVGTAESIEAAPEHNATQDCF